MIGDSDDKINFPHELLLTNSQVVNIRKVFANKLSTDIKFSKMIQSGGFLGRLLDPLLKTGLPLIKNVIKPLGKSVLIPLGLTAAAADAGIHKKILGSGHRTSHHNNTILIISNNEMKDMIRIAKSLGDSGLLMERFSLTIRNEAKERKGGFLSMLLGTLGANLLGNISTGKGINRAGEGIIRPSYENKRQDYEKKLIFNIASYFN